MNNTNYLCAMPTIKQLLEAGYKLHHVASRKGYTRVNERGYAKYYKGRYGEGYIVPIGRHNESTMYEDIAYYIKPSTNNSITNN